MVIEDPSIPNRADSPVAAIRDIATELILTRAQARATARSRTAQTMLVLYPKEGAGPNPTKFENDFAKVVTEPLSDEKSAFVATPNMIGSADFIEKWRVLDLTGPIDDNLHERIDRLIHRPRDRPRHRAVDPARPGGLNQWSAYASLEDNWLGHVEPLAAPVGQAFAEGLTKAANIDRDRIEVIPDPAPLLRRRPAISDVIAAAQLGIVTFAWAAEQMGAPDDAVGDGYPAGGDTRPGCRDGRAGAGAAPEVRQITGGPTTPRTAAHTPTHTIDGARPGRHR